MASILRQIVAGPRARHPEARLDLCYVTDNIVVTSGPSSVWPKKAYRNPTDQLVAFLDRKHGKEWAVFEFRAEGTGYPDSEVYNRIHHFPWPDHHPPPFAIIPNLVAGMRNWLKEKEDRVAVIHCKAGKGRSGTATCSYLISQEGWEKEKALQRFTERRMRSGFGNGVSIPSQLRWVDYVDRWTNHMDKKYIERATEVVEIQVWGLRDGVKVGIEGFLEEGRRIHTFHTFSRDEKTIVDGPSDKSMPRAKPSKGDDEILISPVDTSPLKPILPAPAESSKQEFQDVILKPRTPIKLPTSDINIDCERRNPVKYTGYTMVTSVAHVWFNVWFEGGYEGAGSGVFDIEWDAMDGIKGSARKGIRAFDRIKVVWKYSDQDKPQVVPEPAEGEPVKESKPADWKGNDPQQEKEAKHSDGVDSNRAGATAITMGTMVAEGAASLGKELGLRKSDPESANVSRAASTKDVDAPAANITRIKSDELNEVEDEELDGVKPHTPDGEATIIPGHEALEEREGKADTTVGNMMEKGLATTAKAIASVKGNDKTG